MNNLFTEPPKKKVKFLDRKGADVWYTNRDVLNWVLFILGLTIAAATIAWLLCLGAPQ